MQHNAANKQNNLQDVIQQPTEIKDDRQRFL